jgi:putative transcription antitermination factor YqgF
MGLAVGDDVTGVVSPFDIVPYRGVAQAAASIAATANRISAEWVVVGLPALADGSTGSAARRSYQLAHELRNLGVQVAMQSEYLSTNEARRRARSAGRRPGRPVDDIAAQVVLEEYLETRAGDDG